MFYDDTDVKNTKLRLVDVRTASATLVGHEEVARTHVEAQRLAAATALPSSAS